MKQTMKVLLTFALPMVISAGPAMANGRGGSETVLHTFTYDADGGFPFAGPTMDGKGNLYGVTYFGGATQGVCCGTVYQLTAAGKNNWRYKIIYTFKGGSRGEAPSGGLIADAAGNLYGTAQQGGADLECGIVFELSPARNGTWKKSVLHAFTHPYSPRFDGCTPSSYLVFDKAGNLYGTTQLGGGHNFDDCGFTDWGCGTVFKLAPDGNGKWTETQIHRFPEGNTDGIGPYGGLALDSAGNLWGTTLGATTGSPGTAFELTHDVKGKWKETALFQFTGSSTGYTPQAGLVADNAGNVYGTTYSGGNGAGTVFELTPAGAGQITETLIHQFAPCNNTACPDGLNPFGGLTIDAGGNLYGTTTLGGGAGTACDGGGSIAVGCKRC
jgi:uncharacterized repeat protein (TIGR03803 family)